MPPDTPCLSRVQGRGGSPDEGGEEAAATPRLRRTGPRSVHTLSCMGVGVHLVTTTQATFLYAQPYHTCTCILAHASSHTRLPPQRRPQLFPGQSSPSRLFPISSLLLFH